MDFEFSKDFFLVADDDDEDYCDRYNLSQDEDGDEE